MNRFDQLNDFNEQLFWEKKANGSFRKVHISSKQKEEALKALEKDKEEKRRQEEMKRKAAEYLEMQALQTKKRREKIESETKFLAKSLLRLYKDLDSFEIITITHALLVPEEECDLKEYERIASIYSSHARKEVTEEEVNIITRNALSLVQNIARETIDLKCGELVQVNPVKTLSLY